MACAGAGTYLLTLVFKVEALKSLDAAVFFPLYKVSRPSLAILFGLLLFSETFAAREWLGLGLGLTIPLLLVTRAEEGRQKNLTRGLAMLAGAALTGAVSIALSAVVFHEHLGPRKLVAVGLSVLTVALLG